LNIAKGEVVTTIRSFYDAGSAVGDIQSAQRDELCPAHHRGWSRTSLKRANASLIALGGLNIANGEPRIVK